MTTSNVLPRLTKPSKIDTVGVVGRDIVPTRRRRMSMAAYVYSHKGGWGGRVVMVGIRPGGLIGWGDACAINPFLSETAASMFSKVRGCSADLGGHPCIRGSISAQSGDASDNRRGTPGLGRSGSRRAGALTSHHAWWVFGRGLRVSVKERES